MVNMVTDIGKGMSHYYWQLLPIIGVRKAGLSIGKKAAKVYKECTSHLIKMFDMWDTALAR